MFCFAHHHQSLNITSYQQPERAVRRKLLLVMPLVFCFPYEHCRIPDQTHAGDLSVPNAMNPMQREIKQPISTTRSTPHPS